MRVGVDLGGTKIEIAVLAPSGEVVVRHRVPTPRDSYDGTIAAIRDLVASTLELTGPVPVGIGIPGSLSPATGLVRNANSTQLNGHKLDQDLETALGREVRVQNDANCFALAEAMAGAGRDFHVVLGLILGTGIGAGIVIAGGPLVGANRIGGEWGHNPLPRPTAAERPGPDCFCGRQGCIERWCAGPAIADDHFRVTGETATAPELAARSDAAAKATLDRHVDRLGRALAGVVNILDPDVIVLGGGLANMAHLPGALSAAIRPHVFSDCFETQIRSNELGDSAGVIGAAWLWPETEDNAQ